MSTTFGQCELPRPKVLAVLPCLNEAPFLEDVVSTIFAERGNIDLKIVIADGGSVDGSREIAERLAGTSDFIDVFRNSARLQSCGVNAAVEKFGARYEYLLRVDVHAAYPKRYCETLVKEMRRIGCDSVVVSMEATGDGCFQRAAAAAQNSILGNGGSDHRTKSTGRFVDHGHHALMSMEAFTRAGGYDPSFSQNEDAELDMRLTAAGSRIFLSRDASILYFARSTPGALFRQYRNHGIGRAKTMQKHRARPKLRHVVLLGSIAFIVLAVLAPIQPVLAIPLLIWSVSCMLWGLAIGVVRRDPCAAGAGIAAVIMHFAWALGFLEGFTKREVHQCSPETAAT